MPQKFRLSSTPCTIHRRYDAVHERRRRYIEKLVVENATRYLPLPMTTNTLFQSTCVRLAVVAMRYFVFLAWLLPFISACLLEMLHSRLDTLLPQIGATHLTVVLPGKGPASWRQLDALKTVASTRHVRVNVESLDTLLTSQITLAQVAVLAPLGALARLAPVLPSWGPGVAVLLYSNSSPTSASFNAVPYPVTCDSRVYIVSPLAAGELALDELYHAGAAEPVVRRVALATRRTWLFNTMPVELRRADLRGEVMRIARPSLMYDAVDVSGLGILLGLTQLYITETLPFLNSSWQPRRYDGDLIGTRNAKGEWSGVIGMLQREDADLGNFGLTSSRIWNGVVDLIYPFSVSRFKVYARKPEFSYGLSSLANGFSVPLWCASLSTLLALGACVWMAMRWPTRERTYVNVSLCALLVLSGCCLNGWEFRPRETSARVLCAVTSVLGLLLNVAYSSSLRARLTTGSARLPFEDLATLMAKPDYTVLLFPGSPPHEDLQNAAGGVSDYTSLPAGMQRACVERAGMVGLSYVCDGLAKEASCEIFTAKGEYFRRDLHFPARHRYPYTRILGYYIHRYVESGLYRHWYFKPSTLPRDPVVRSTELNDVAPLLLLYSACAAFSGTLLLAEIAVARLRAMKMRMRGKVITEEGF